MNLTSVCRGRCWGLTLHLAEEKFIDKAILEHVCTLLKKKTELAICGPDHLQGRSGRIFSLGCVQTSTARYINRTGRSSVTRFSISPCLVISVPKPVMWQPESLAQGFKQTLISLNNQERRRKAGQRRGGGMTSEGPPSCMSQSHEEPEGKSVTLDALWSHHARVTHVEPSRTETWQNMSFKRFNCVETKRKNLLSLSVSSGK